MKDVGHKGRKVHGCKVHEVQGAGQRDCWAGHGEDGGPQGARCRAGGATCKL